MYLGACLVSLRRRADLSAAEVGRRLGRTRQAVLAWEHGRARPPSGLLSAYLDAVGASDAERLEALRLAGEDHDAAQGAA